MGTVHGGTINATIDATHFAGRLFQLDRRLFLADLFGSSGTTRSTTSVYIRRPPFVGRRVGTVLVPRLAKSPDANSYTRRHHVARLARPTTLVRLRTNANALANDWLPIAYWDPMKDAALAVFDCQPFMISLWPGLDPNALRWRDRKQQLTFLSAAGSSPQSGVMKFVRSIV